MQPDEANMCLIVIYIKSKRLEFQIYAVIVYSVSCHTGRFIDVNSHLHFINQTDNIITSLH